MEERYRAIDQSLVHASDVTCTRELMSKAHLENPPVSDFHNSALDDRIEDYVNLRKHRIQTFLDHVHSERRRVIEAMLGHARTLPKLTEPAG